MGATLTTITNALKTLYLPPIREQLWNSNVLMKKVRRDMRSLVGKNATIPIHISRNQPGVGARAESAALPTAGSQGFAAAIVPVRYNYGRIQLSGPAIKASRSNAGAFASAIDIEVKGMVRDLKKDISRQLFGDASGTLGFANSTPTSGTSLDFDGLYNPFGIEEGMVLVAGTTAQGTTLHTYNGSTNEITVSAVSYSNSFGTAGTITTAETFTGSATIADGDFLFRSGNQAGGTTAKEMMGLRGIVSASDPPLADLQGLDRSTYSLWKANTVGTEASSPILDNGALSMRTAKTESERRGGMVDLIITGHLARDAYESLCVDQKRYVNTMTLDGGYKALEFDGIPVVTDTDCVDSRMYFIDTSSLTFYYMADFEWMEDMSASGAGQGNILTKVSGYDAYDAVLTMYGELGVHNCRKNTVFLTDGAVA